MLDRDVKALFGFGAAVVDREYPQGRCNVRCPINISRALDGEGVRAGVPLCPPCICAFESDVAGMFRRHGNQQRKPTFGSNVIDENTKILADTSLLYGSREKARPDIEKARGIVVGKNGDGESVIVGIHAPSLRKIPLSVLYGESDNLDSLPNAVLIDREGEASRSGLVVNNQACRESVVICGYRIVSFIHGGDIGIAFRGHGDIESDVRRCRPREVLAVGRGNANGSRRVAGSVRLVERCGFWIRRDSDGSGCYGIDDVKHQASVYAVEIAPRQIVADGRDKELVISVVVCHGREG